ncbi:MAG: type II toxin-antitoxin system Phd/YefM family antitoxin [Clostridia bacterium]|nr:type II toxin-antitoxin system Phd/YefM family antitoxin [Clostridia bacterium]
MLIDTNVMFSITQANRNFSAVARSVDRNGEAVVLKNNKPKYLVIDMENDGFILDLTDDEKIDIVAKRVLNRYLPAFKELAK